MDEEEEERRSSLSDLVSFINLNGEGRLSDAVGEERTQLERAVVENEIQADVMFLRRRRRLGLEQEGARLLARFYSKVMANEENSLRCYCQKRVMKKMLVKELIPFIHMNLNDSPFEDHWPITGINLKHSTMVCPSSSPRFTRVVGGKPSLSVSKEPCTAWKNE